MKTIEVTDEMYAFLLDLSEKMNTQDNRLTASPFMYILTEMVERPAHEGCGEERVVDTDGDEWDRDMFNEEDEMRALCQYNGVQYERGDKVEILKAFEDYEIEDYLINENGYSRIYVSTERESLHKMKSCSGFFTKDAIYAHIAQNKHHYNDAQSFVVHAWRNPEMAKVHAFLLGLSTKEKT